MATADAGLLLGMLSGALAAHGVPGGVGLRMNHPDGTGVIAGGTTPGERWTARVVLEAMGVSGIHEDDNGFLVGVLPKGAPLRPAPGPGTIGEPPPEPPGSVPTAGPRPRTGGRKGAVNAPISDGGNGTRRSGNSSIRTPGDVGTHAGRHFGQPVGHQHAQRLGRRGAGDAEFGHQVSDGRQPHRDLA